MKEEIIRMVWQVVRSDASSLLGCDVDDLERFAVLIAAAEREACAKLCNEADKSTHPSDLADAIRARGQDPMPLFDDWPGGWKK